MSTKQFTACGAIVANVEKLSRLLRPPMCPAIIKNIERMRNSSRLRFLCVIVFVCIVRAKNDDGINKLKITS